MLGTQIFSYDLSLGETFESVGGIVVKVSRLSYPRGTKVAEIDEGTVSADFAVATEDGRGYIGEFHHPQHHGPEGEPVYFETYGVDGRRTHGWLDKGTRRIVQVG